MEHQKYNEKNSYDEKQSVKEDNLKSKEYQDFEELDHQNMPEFNDIDKSSFSSRKLKNNNFSKLKKIMTMTTATVGSAIITTTVIVVASIKIMITSSVVGEETLEMEVKIDNPTKSPLVALLDNGSEVIEQNLTDVTGIQKLSFEGLDYDSNYQFKIVNKNDGKVLIADDFKTDRPKPVVKPQVEHNQSHDNKPKFEISEGKTEIITKTENVMEDKLSDYLNGRYLGEHKDNRKLDNLEYDTEYTYEVINETTGEVIYSETFKTPKLPIVTGFSEVSENSATISLEIDNPDNLPLNAVIAGSSYSLANINGNKTITVSGLEEKTNYSIEVTTEKNIKVFSDSFTTKEKEKPKEEIKEEKPHKKPHHHGGGSKPVIRETAVTDFTYDVVYSDTTLPKLTYSFNLINDKNDNIRLWFDNMDNKLSPGQYNFGPTEVNPGQRYDIIIYEGEDLDHKIKVLFEKSFTVKSTPKVSGLGYSQGLDTLDIEFDLYGYNNDLGRTSLKIDDKVLVEDVYDLYVPDAMGSVNGKYIYKFNDGGNIKNHTSYKVELFYTPYETNKEQLIGSTTAETNFVSDIDENKFVVTSNRNKINIKAFGRVFEDELLLRITPKINSVVQENIPDFTEYVLEDNIEFTKELVLTDTDQMDTEYQFDIVRRSKEGTLTTLATRNCFVTLDVITNIKVNEYTSDSITLNYDLNKDPNTTLFVLANNKDLSDLNNTLNAQANGNNSLTITGLAPGTLQNIVFKRVDQLVPDSPQVEDATISQYTKLDVTGAPIYNLIKIDSASGINLMDSKYNFKIRPYTAEFSEYKPVTLNEVEGSYIIDKYVYNLDYNQEYEIICYVNDGKSDVNLLSLYVTTEDRSVLPSINVTKVNQDSIVLEIVDPKQTPEKPTELTLEVIDKSKNPNKSRGVINLANTGEITIDQSTATTTGTIGQINPGTNLEFKINNKYKNNLANISKTTTETLNVNYGTKPFVEMSSYGDENSTITVNPALTYTISGSCLMLDQLTSGSYTFTSVKDNITYTSDFKITDFKVVEAIRSGTNLYLHYNTTANIKLFDNWGTELTSTPAANNDYKVNITNFNEGSNDIYIKENDKTIGKYTVTNQTLTINNQGTLEQTVLSNTNSKLNITGIDVVNPYNGYDLYSSVDDGLSYNQVITTDILISDNVTVNSNTEKMINYYISPTKLVDSKEVVKIGDSSFTAVSLANSSVDRFVNDVNYGNGILISLIDFREKVINEINLKVSLLNNDSLVKEINLTDVNANDENLEVLGNSIYVKDILGTDFDLVNKVTVTGYFTIIDTNVNKTKVSLNNFELVAPDKPVQASTNENPVENTETNNTL